ncbi:hypothetical protein FLONG3_6898 [Fusarium longipes]|uniref:Uncharacterized protein n=1 Tax=Fusarium longipes TaxID=694270 RepID=A0A395SIV5_9HYPO|nr:hypothetical protein FLONG3_6898 [Fusarium longipes]
MSPPSANIEPRNRALRQRFIVEFFKSHSRWNLQQWVALRKAVKVELCAMVDTRGHQAVGALYFEYQADHIAWEDYVKALGLAGDKDFDWPWAPEARPRMEQPPASGTERTGVQSTSPIPAPEPSKTSGPAQSTKDSICAPGNHGAESSKSVMTAGLNKPEDTGKPVEPVAPLPRLNRAGDRLRAAWEAAWAKPDINLHLP